MEELNPRQKKLIHLLVQNEHYLPVAFYSEKLGKSSRTIYSDLKKIQTFLSNDSLILEKKPRVGIQLSGTVAEKLVVLERINGYSIEPKVGTQERQWLIAKRLLIDEETVTQQMLAQHFHVSPTSIASDLEKLIEKYRFTLSASKRGTKISGSEEEIQHALFRFCEEYLDSNEIISEDLFQETTKETLSNLFPQQLITVIFEQLKKVKQQPEFYFPEQYMKSLLIRLVVFCFRLMKGNHIEEKEFLFDQIKMIDTYLIANELLKKVAESIVIDYDEEDISYVNRQLVGYGVKLHTKEQEGHERYAETIHKVLKNMSEIMQVDFLSDVQLSERFTSHFIPMIYRLKMGIVITNPLVEEIRTQYAITFSATWYALANAEKKLGVHFNDEEVALVAMYFQVSLEKSQNGKKILIVCPNGMGTSELIFNKIKRILPAQDIAEITTIDKLYRKNLDNVDLIISSVKLENVNKPIIKVSTLVTQEDIKNITSLYSNLFYSEEPDEAEILDFPYLRDVIYLDFIYTHKCFSDKQACLNWLINQLEKKQVVTKEFRKEVFAREAIGETALATGVAIPHASPQNVLQSKIAIVTLAQPIMWDQRKIHYVLLMCIAKSDRKLVRGVITDIHKIVQSEKKLTRFFFERDATEIYQAISRR
ncbi:BglG family transcription antiterminator [Enterococcus sp.]|uniref:BglG family transcription antiterminator n=1 Tax=Enterococcus sp. TaxID=35783 RepID=UPI002908B43E|nr:BglG family transcription antiterminator [Enterococcus sp.]MDU5334473.1 BglG family transcription antiterminator [Enterococcus sp.]